MGTHGGARRPPVVNIGERFGRLTVLEQVESRNARRCYRCLCTCGEETIVSSKKLRDGYTTSCGCKQREAQANMGVRTAPFKSTHGHTTGGRSPTYRSWEGMLRRCRATTSVDYPRYGAKGVAVCDEWTSFEQFLTDMGERPEGLTLDRIDPTGNYEPGNCRWADALTQRLNRRPDAKRR